MQQKPRKTLYWGVALEKSQEIVDIEKKVLEKHPHHTPKAELHSTLYFGKDKDDVFLDYEGKKVELLISGYGMTENASSIKVDAMNYVPEKVEEVLGIEELIEKLSIKEKTVVPSFSKCQHITLTLAPKVKPVDSYKSIEENFVSLEKPIVVEGIIKRF